MTQNSSILFAIFASERLCVRIRVNILRIHQLYLILHSTVSILKIRCVFFSYSLFVVSVVHSYLFANIVNILKHNELIFMRK